MTAAAPEKPQSPAEKMGIVDNTKSAAKATSTSTALVPAGPVSEPVVLWNPKEAKREADRFVKNYADLRMSVYEHFKHKAHVALKFEDSHAGFAAYCHEKLRLDSDPSTIRLQIAAAQVSETVGVDVPMVIARHIAKLPREQQKSVHDEVVTARQPEGAAAKSANEMEEDVRRVVRQRLGVEDKPKSTPPVSNTNPPYPNEHNNSQKVSGPIGEASARAQEPRTAPTAANVGISTSEGVDELQKALGVAVALLRNWALAWENEDNPLGDETSKKTEAFLKGFDNKG